MGYFLSAATTALMKKASGVTFTPDLAFSSFTLARNASRSVTSASSNCVTCGIITQLRASAGPEIFWMRERAWRSTGPNFAKSTFGHAGKPSSANPPPPCATAGAPAARERLLHETLDVFLEDAALGPEPATLADVDAQLAREAAHAGARVGRHAFVHG